MDARYSPSDTHNVDFGTSDQMGMSSWAMSEPPQLPSPDENLPMYSDMPAFSDEGHQSVSDRPGFEAMSSQPHSEQLTAVQDMNTTAQQGVSFSNPNWLNVIIWPCQWIVVILIRVDWLELVPYGSQPFQGIFHGSELVGILSGKGHSS